MRKIIDFEEFENTPKVTREYVEAKGFDDSVVVASIVPVKKLIEISDSMANALIDRSPDGFYMLDKISKDIYMPIVYLRTFSNIILDDITLNEGFDWVSKMNEIADENCDERIYFWDIPSYELLENIFNNGWDMYLDRNAYEPRMSLFEEKLNQYFEQLSNSLSEVIDRVDPNEVVKSLGNGFDVIAEKLPDFNDTEQAAKTLKTLYKIVSPFTKK